MTNVGEATVLVLKIFFFSSLSPTFFSWLVIEAKKRGEVGLDFHSVSGFRRCIPSGGFGCPCPTHPLSREFDGTEGRLLGARFFRQSCLSASPTPNFLRALPLARVGDLHQASRTGF